MSFFPHLRRWTKQSRFLLFRLWVMWPFTRATAITGFLLSEKPSATRSGISVLVWRVWSRVGAGAGMTVGAVLWLFVTWCARFPSRNNSIGENGGLFCRLTQNCFNFFLPQKRPATFTSLFFLELLWDRTSALMSFFNRDATLPLIVHKLSELCIDMARHIKVENQQIICSIQVWRELVIEINKLVSNCFSVGL